jgi:hypothetical protein
MHYITNRLSNRVTENVITVWEAVMGTNRNTKPKRNIHSYHHPFFIV